MKTMQKNSILQGLLAGTFGLSAILAFGPVAVAQQSGAVAKPAALSTAASAATASAGVAAAANKFDEEEAAAPSKPGEGIKIHGHWVLELKDKSGKLVDRREFNNSLVASGGMATGDQALAALLSGNASAGGLAIAFISGPTTTAGLDASGFCDVGDGGQVAVPANIHCFDFYPTNGIVGNFSATQQSIGTGQSGLTETVSFSPTASIVLTGNYNVPAALGTLGTINAVETYAGLCTSVASNLGSFRLTGSNLAFQQADVAGKNCNGNPLNEYGHAVALTETNITSGGTPAPLPVTTGQIITVTVTLSFS